MRRFLLHITLFGLPFLVLGLLYVLFDPFHVFGPLPENRPGVNFLSTDYFSTELYRKNKAAGEHYNTFVFGNSRGLAFHPKDVCRLTDSCGYFNFSAPGESLLNIRKKIELIQEQGDRLQTVVIVLDEKVLMNTHNEHPFYQGPTYLHHPVVSNYGYWEFHKRLLSYFFKDFFWFKITAHRISGGQLFSELFAESEGGWTFDHKTNYVINEELEQLAASDSMRYVQQRLRHFSKGNLNKTAESPLKLSERDRVEFGRIIGHLKRANADYHVIFGPIWQGSQITSGQFEKLINDEQIENRIHDYRGFMPYVENPWYWYENSHYRPVVGAAILEDIYASKTARP